MMEDLQSRVDAAKRVSGPLLAEATEELRSVFPGAPSHPAPATDATEAVLHLVDRCLPGWTIALRGIATEPHGHWHCVLRESDASDGDEVVGNGSAPTVALALLRALVSVARFKA